MVIEEMSVNTLNAYDGDDGGYNNIMIMIVVMMMMMIVMMIKYLMEMKNTIGYKCSLDTYSW